MKWRLIFYLTSIFCMISCHDEKEGLGYNIMADESVPLFTFEGHTITPIDIEFEVIVTFSNIYSDLPAEMQDRIKAVRLYRNGMNRGSIELNQTTLRSVTTNTVCYQLAFVTVDNELSRMSGEYCVEL